MKLSESVRRVLFGIIMALSVMSLAASICIYGDTLVSAWIPFGTAFLLGIAALPLSPKWERITMSSRVWVNCLCNIFVVGCVASFVILGGNYMLASEASAHREDVTVVGKHKETRYRPRRVGRRYVGSGKTYHAYRVVVEMADGRRKGITVPYSQYRKIKVGSVREIVLAQGFFGMPIVKQELLTLE